MTTSRVEEYLARAHSGSLLIPETADGKLLVRKVMPNTPRNHASVQKQQQFDSGDRIKAVPVLELDVMPENIKFSMPFIYGLSGEDVVTQMDVVSAENLRTLLGCYYKGLWSDSCEVEFDRETTQKKIEQLISNPKLSKTAKRLLGHAKFLADRVVSYPKSECHGDLTLNNMIFEKSSGVLFLIDFLQVYINSPLIDLAKMEQDFKFGWSCRFSNKSVKEKSRITGRYMLSEFDGVNKKYIDFFNLISLLYTIRIYPYCKDSETFAWLEETIALQAEYM